MTPIDKEQKNLATLEVGKWTDTAEPDFLGLAVKRIPRLPGNHDPFNSYGAVSENGD